MLTKTHNSSKPSQTRQTKQQQTNSTSSSVAVSQQQAPQTMAGQRQHEALASLFRSLSSLASGSSQQQQQGQLHRQMDQLSNCQPAGASLGPLGSGPLAPASLASSSPGGSSIACSLQSAIAAAVMQQQLTSVTSAIGGQQQLTPLVAPQMQAPISAGHRGPAASSNSLTAAYHHLSEQMMPVNYSFLEQHGQTPSQVAATIPLEQDVQFPAGQTTTNLINQQLNQNQQQPNQRINYCTICNKELCNKYFMKTHMLKMHGISLEMEQQSTSGDTGQRSEGSPPDQSSAGGEIRPAPESAGSDRNQSAGNSPLDTNWGSSSQAEQHTSKGNKQAQKTPAGKQTASKQSNKTKPTPNSTQANNANSNTKPTTSVMNGFAGNSMGGVVCDICNKELCSKYFLKVHKQNTHGIMTDYQDAGQFVYPFVSHLAGQVPNGFMGAGMPPAGVLSFPPICFNQQSNPLSQSGGDPTTGGAYAGEPVGPTGPKRARAMGSEGHASKQRDPNNKSRAPLNSTSELASETNTGDKPLDPFYKLMIAQQQQQQQQQQPQLPLQPNFDPINQMSALMCYGAMGPFGPAGLSPTMVVEMILRNQHLFNRNTNKQQQSTPQQGRTTDKDRQRDKNNNGDSKQQKPGGAKGSSKEANNSRYFTHYTEACPMCDRRFKSIKWLKTHMMNDHKQEIGAYMQMMMQSMCPTKSQPTGNEHLQQPQQQNFHQQQQHHQFQLEPPGPCYPMAFNSCGPQQQQQQHQKQPYQPAPISLCASNSQPAFPPALAQPLQPPPPPSQLGIVPPMQEDQFSLIQGYLDQQRQVLQQQHHHHHQGVINLSSPESSHNRLATLTNLNAATRDTTSSSSSSSPASFAKTSPRSMTSVLNEHHHDDHHHHHHHQLQVDQLDLSIKYNPDSQSCPLESGVDFLQTRDSSGAHAGAHQMSDFSEDEDDDCSSTSSSSRRPHNKPNEPEHFSEANASQSV